MTRHEQVDELPELHGRFADALAQRWHLDHVRAEAVEEVVAETALVPQHIEALVGRGDDPPGKALPLAPAHRGESALLEYLQQLDLHRNRHLADFVEEKRAVRIAALEDALVVIDRAGERTFAMAEKLRLDEVLRKLRQVDGNEAVDEVGGEAPLVRQIRNEFRAADRRGRRTLPGTGLAEKQRREVLHLVPERRFVAAHVVGEHVVPKRLAQALHRLATAGERATYEIERTPQLEEEREESSRPVLGESHLHELAYRVLAERRA